MATKNQQLTSGDASNMASTLPPGKTQFLDANGKPLAGGFAYFFVPGTSTPKDTFLSDGTTANLNPVILDAAGQAVIWGNGSYRQVVLDALGNQQWDQVTTAATPSSTISPVFSGTLTVPSAQISGGELITVTPTGDPVTTLTSLNVQGSTISTTTREFLSTFGFISNKRNGVGSGNASSAALYAGVQAQAGTGDVWAMRATMTLDASSGTYAAVASEITIANAVGNRGETLGAPGLVAPVSYGLALDATGTNRNTAAVFISGPVANTVWNRGVCIANNSVAQVAVQDLSSSTISYEVQGTHTYGWDSNSATFSGAAIRLGNGQALKGRNAANSADWSLIQSSGSNIVLGDNAAAYVFANQSILPYADSVITLGANAFRWASVWAANGTIQTSDPTLKTDIAAIPPMVASGLVAVINPITFRWVDGGGGKPGKRLHWGWNAENIKTAFDAAGMDFGGFILAEDGTRHLRPDQLLPVLWRHVQTLEARLAVLEARA
jgi:hypothetical protein